MVFPTMDHAFDTNSSPEAVYLKCKGYKIGKYKQ